MTTELPTPVAFISYSWTTERHCAWVRELATRLVHDGVEVRLDVWHLEGGQDKYKFMESMVTDASVTHVLVVCDKRYKEKADVRGGGVGDETAIITPEVYGDSQRKKYVPVIAERDEYGVEFVPAYLASRKYFDLSSQQASEEQYKDLLRHLFGKPLHVPPPLGKPPSFLSDTSATDSKTRHLASRATHSVKTPSRSSRADFADYYAELNEVLGTLRTKRVDGEPPDETVLAAIHRSKPYRDELAAHMNAVCQLDAPDDWVRSTTDFFEAALKHCDAQEAGTHWAHEFEAPRFFVMEAFITLAALLAKHRCERSIATLLGESFLVPRIQGDKTRDFTIFEWSFPVLDEHRRQRLKTNRTCFTADLLHDRCTDSFLPFRDLQQAEGLLYFRSARSSTWSRWRPRSWVYLSSSEAFELFAAAKSPRRWPTLRAALGVESIEDLVSQFESAFPNERDRHFFWDSNRAPWPLHVPSLFALPDLAPDRFGRKD